MDPLDHVVADVEQVGAFGQQFNPERVDVARRLERLVPPAGSVEQRGADRLRRAPVQVVDDRFDRFAALGPRVTLLEPVTVDEAGLERLVDRSRVVEVTRRVEAGPRIRAARLVTGIRERNEGVAEPHGHRFGRGRDLSHPGTRTTVGRP